MPRRSQPVARAAARLAVPALLELGGESASLVLPDVNLDYAVAVAVAVYSSIVGLSGQGCAMPTRLLGHDSVHDAMVEKVSAVTQRSSSGTRSTRRSAPGRSGVRTPRPGSSP